MSVLEVDCYTLFDWKHSIPPIDIAHANHDPYNSSQIPIGIIAAACRL